MPFDHGRNLSPSFFRSEAFVPRITGRVFAQSWPSESHIRDDFRVPLMGHTPSTAGTFRKKFRKNSGKTPETLSERFLEFPSRVRLGCPKPYNSRHLRLPERFQNSLPPSTAGGASFSRIGSGEGLSELVMEFPAVLGVFLISEGCFLSGGYASWYQFVSFGSQHLHFYSFSGHTPLFCLLGDNMFS